jgi:hypothetical protein
MIPLNEIPGRGEGHMTAENHGAKITPGVEGERIWFNGALITIKVSSRRFRRCVCDV